MKKSLLILTTILLQGCSVFGIRTVELLEYDVIENEDHFDIRQYQDYWVASTVVQGDYDESSSESFGRLFKYISGENSTRSKIAMTGPVLQQEGEKISMTGPVIRQNSGQGWVMEFVLPAKYKNSSPPIPLDPDVQIINKSGFKAAALRYSGNLGIEKFNQMKTELLKLVEQKQLQPVGNPFSAGYDPPWTIPFLKRNEVLVVIQ